MVLCGGLCALATSRWCERCEPNGAKGNAPSPDNLLSRVAAHRIAICDCSATPLIRGAMV